MYPLIVALLLSVTGRLVYVVAYLEIEKKGEGARGYISGVHFQKCSKFSLIYIFYIKYKYKMFHLQRGVSIAAHNVPLLYVRYGLPL